MWDLGGQTSIRPYWRCYYPNTDAIIFVVDSCDSERLGIAKQELMAMLEVTEEKRRGEERREEYFCEEFIFREASVTFIVNRVRGRL